MGAKPPILPELLKTVIENNRAAHRPPMKVVLVSLEDIKVGKRFRREVGDLTELTASIEAVGLLNPITVLPDFTLVAGERRLAAFKQLKREAIPARIVETLADAGDVLRAERDENLARKNFTPLEISAIAEALLPEAERAARLRQVANLKQVKESDRSGNFPERGKGEVLDHIGAIVGVSGKTLRKIQQVVKKGSPELIGAMDKGEISVDRAVKSLQPEKPASPSNPRASQIFEITYELKTGRRVNLQMKAGDGLPLSEGECRQVLELALKQVKG